MLCKSHSPRARSDLAVEVRRDGVFGLPQLKLANQQDTQRGDVQQQLGMVPACLLRVRHRIQFGHHQPIEAAHRLRRPGLPQMRSMRVAPGRAGPSSADERLGLLEGDFPRLVTPAASNTGTAGRSRPRFVNRAAPLAKRRARQQEGVSLPVVTNSAPAAFRGSS
jgi:hypothetical protein